MKKTIFLALVIVFSAFNVWAAPFVVSDTYPTTTTQPTYFNVVMDGGAAVQSAPQVMGDNSVRLHYDVGAVTTGTHSMTVAACNEWGCSSTVPFSFTKGVPALPSGIKLNQN